MEKKPKCAGRHASESKDKWSRFAAREVVRGDDTRTSIRNTNMIRKRNKKKIDGSNEERADNTTAPYRLVYMLDMGRRTSVEKTIRGKKDSKGSINVAPHEQKNKKKTYCMKI